MAAARRLPSLVPLDELFGDWGPVEGTPESDEIEDHQNEMVDYIPWEEVEAEATAQETQGSARPRWPNIQEVRLTDFDIDGLFDAQVGDLLDRVPNNPVPNNPVPNTPVPEAPRRTVWERLVDPEPGAVVSTDMATLLSEFLYATECNLATLEGLIERKRSAKSEVDRQRSICLRMIRTCRQHDEVGGIQGIDKEYPRVSRLLQGGKAEPSGIEGALDRWIAELRKIFSRN